MTLARAREKTLSELNTVAESVLKRYWRFAIAPAVVTLVLGLFISVYLDDYYTADTLIFIQPQRITSKIIESQGGEEMRERLEALVQEIISRHRLRTIMKRYDLYPNIRTPLEQERAVRSVKRAIDIGPAKSPTGEKRFQTFQLRFTHRDPKKAYEVTKALSDLFIEESIVSRRSEIQGTQEFLEAQLNQARKELEETEGRQQQFIKENFDKLPEHLDATIARLQNAQAQLAMNAQTLTAEESRKANLQNELNDAKRMGSGGLGDLGSNSSDPYESLAQLESALVVLTSRYSERHPDVVNTKKRIELLRQQLGSGKGSAKKSVNPSVGLGSNSLTRSLRREMNEVNVRIATLKNENKRLQKLVNKLQKNIETMPLKEQELIKIRRDYANRRGNYERLLAAKEEVELQSSLVRSQKAAQFRIIEAAELPIKPAGPNRMLVAVSAILFSIAVFFGIPAGLFLLNGSYKSSDEIEGDLGVSVLGVIPPMESSSAAAKSRKYLSTSVMGSAVTFALGCVLVYFLL